MAALFTPQGRVEISYNNAGELEPLGGAPRPIRLDVRIR
jgi:hypothetical protein